MNKGATTAQRREAQYATTKVMLEAESLEQAAPEILAGICRSLGWSLGAVWAVDHRSNRIGCVEVWGRPGSGLAEFEMLTRQGTLAPGKGLPGRCWATGKPVWIEDVVTDHNFSRAPWAGEHGLHGAFAFPIVAEGEVVGVVEFFSDRIEEPDELLLRTMQTIGTQIGQFMHRKRSEAALRERLEFLSDSSRVLGSSLNYPVTLSRVAELAVPDIADWCAVDLVREDGTVELVAVSHTDPEKAALARDLRERYPLDLDAPYGVGHVIRSGEPELYSLIPEAMLEVLTRDEEHLEMIKSLGLKSWMVVPLRARGRILGALSLALASADREYEDEDLGLALDLADRAALAMDNARLYSERSRVAQTLQRSLLPPTLPLIPGVGLAARYQAAAPEVDVGGDFYDIFRVGSKTWSVVIGDVCGKGPSAASMTALARYTLRAAAMERRKPSAILKLLNEALLVEEAEQQFCTAVFVSLRPSPGGASVKMASAGHPLPLLIREGGEVEAAGRGGTLLGVYPDPDLFDAEAQLSPGDALLLYTDGLLEARRDGETFGDKRLEAVCSEVAGLTAPEMAERLEKEVLDFQPGAFRDDIAFLFLRAEP